MKSKEKKAVLAKLLQETLSAKEEEQLLSSSFVNQRMREQWESSGNEASPDRSQHTKIWNGICENIWNDKTSGKFQLYKIYSIAVSFLLLLGMGFSVYFLSFAQKKNHTTYVVASGIQSIESIKLPDGTTVQLGPNSKLEYPSEFTGRTRSIKLDGQAFFDVIPHKRKPFIVETSTMNVQALGTAFEIFCHKVESKSETVLLNGKIKVGIPNSETKKITEYYLLPNEKLLIDKNGGKVSKMVVNADTYTAWRKQKRLTFENEKLSMIIPRLEQWYGRNIICQKDLAEKYRFTFKIKDESLERILYMFGESSPLKYEQANNGDYSLNLVKINKQQ